MLPITFVKTFSTLVLIQNDFLQLFLIKLVKTITGNMLPKYSIKLILKNMCLNVLLRNVGK